MKFSKFSDKFGADCGILQLMDDLGRYTGQEGVIMLGGGNPSHIPQVQQYFRRRMSRLLENDTEFEKLISNYPAPSGERPFVDALVEFFQQEYGWPITAENVALTNGSQTAFFYLFNMFGGEFPDGSRKKILLPLAPEYIGYEDVGLDDNLFRSFKPEIDFLGDHIFKYRVDFSALELTADIGAICVSRPTNPTGNVLTGDEIERLSAIAVQHNIPLIVDNAYGLPFPNIIFTDEQPTWEPHIIMCMSLSKLGLPGARTGIIIADKEVISRITGINAIISLAPGNFGASLAIEAIRDRHILYLSREYIRPHYQRKAQFAVDCLRTELDGLDFFIHKPEGAIFLWVWFRGMPITSQELYERLKERKVLVIPGEHFFPGLADDWDHKYECIRLNYAQDEETVRRGVEIIAEVVRHAYAGVPAA